MANKPWTTVPVE